MSKFKKLFKSGLAPIALSLLAPGIGTAIGAGLGATGVGASALGSGILGAGTGLLSGGGLKGALTGGLAGAGGSLLSSGSLSNILGGNLGSGNPSVIGGLSNPNAPNVTFGVGGLSNSSGILSNVGGGSSMFGGGGSNLFSNVLSAGLGTSANDDAEEALLRAQQQGAAKLAPFENTSFNPEDLQNDPGYQFQLQQGEQALQRSQAARGNVFSGAALKAAQEYGQGLAGTTFDAANSRYNANRGFNYGVAQDQAGVLGNIGNIKANSGINNSNLLSGALSGILGSNAINNQGQTQQRIVGYDPQTGQPIYG
jgi:hypothetical protein